MQRCQRAQHYVKNIFSETYYIDTFTYVYRSISCPERPHISNIHLWKNNAHVFNASTVNPGARTGTQPDILCPPAHGCERSDSTVSGRVVFSEAARRVIHVSTFFTRIGIESLLRQLVCAENYLFYWYAKFVAICWLLMKPAAMLKVWTALVYFKYAKWLNFIFDEIREIGVDSTGNFLYIYPYDFFFKLNYMMCTSRPS